MKVCTDSCLFGAWIPVPENTNNILDIGTGTGLLSLMLAQRSFAKIDAVEIDYSASRQATENVQQSPWVERIDVLHGDIRTLSLPHSYDLILSNPPFYENDVLSELPGEQLAKHSSHLTLEALIHTVKSHLSPAGYFAILLPYKRKTAIETIAARYNLFPVKTAWVQQTPKHPYFRYMALFSTIPTIPVTEEIYSIKDEQNQYSESVKALLQPYYLFL